MSEKKCSLAVLVAILGVVLLAGACHKKQVAAPPPPPPPPAAPPAPTVTLTAEPGTIEQGHAATLSWTSQNATSLDLQPGVGTVQAQGSTSVSPSESTTYTITATGLGGTNSQSARVTVTVPPPPPPPPPPVATVSEEDLFAREVKDAYFDFDKADIRPDAQQALTADGNFLKEHQDIQFTIEGNCDERGSEEYNLGLGDRRATAAKNFLVDFGISADRISTLSFGKSHAAHCTDDDCWQKDRHDHFKMGTEGK